MKARQQVLLVAGVVTLAVAGVAWTVHATHPRPVPTSVAAAATSAPPRAAAAPHPFSRAQTYAFLAAAKRAEAIGDPLARCLAYPDPPGSHWAPDTVAAYCHYNLQSLPDFAGMRALIEQGKAVELDRRLAAALHAQQTRAEARGLLDRIYRTAFDNGSFDIRPTLDAWKRQSPDSAFAWAASGRAYVAMAMQARGGAYIAQTPESNLRAMDNLLREGVDDLRHAVALEPKITPAYTGLIHAAGLNGGDAVLDATVREALAAAPDDYSIYSIAMWARQPKWGGSLAAMDALAAQAQVHAAANPLLRLLLAERPYYEVYEADRPPKDELARYPAVLDRLAALSLLGWVGRLADQVHDLTAVAIYQSERLRFQPDDDAARTSRAYALLDYDEADWAVADLGRVLGRSPHDARAREARAYAYDLQEDHAHAEQDLRALLADDPDNLQVQWKLGWLYMDWEHWAQSWSIADGMIHGQPQSPAGWLLRAYIQQRQPRGGLADTVRQIEERFGKDPAMAQTLVELRAAVALRKHGGLDVAAPKAR